MKRLLFTAILLLLASPCWAWNWPVITAMQSSGETPTYDFFYDADHASGDEYAYTGTGSVNGAETGTVTQPTGSSDPGSASSDGSQVLKLSSWDARISWPVTSGDIFDSSEGYVSAEVYAADVNNGTEIFSTHCSAGTCGGRVYFFTNADGTITLHHSSVATCIATSTDIISDATWTTVYARWSVTSNLCSVKVGSGSWVDGTNDPSHVAMAAFTTSEPSYVGAGAYHREVDLRPFYIDALTVYTTATP